MIHRADRCLLQSAIDIAVQLSPFVKPNLGFPPKMKSGYKFPKGFGGGQPPKENDEDDDDDDDEHMDNKDSDEETQNTSGQSGGFDKAMQFASVALGTTASSSFSSRSSRSSAVFPLDFNLGSIISVRVDNETFAMEVLHVRKYCALLMDIVCCTCDRSSCRAVFCANVA